VGRVFCILNIPEGVEKKVHENFRRIIALSWERCRQHGLEPNEGCLKTHPRHRVTMFGERQRLLEIASPFMKTIYYAINEYRFVLMLTDEEGILLDYRHDALSEKALEDMNFHIGVSMAEKHVGTNGVGTAIASDGPIMVYGDEHYCTAARSWASFGVPIHNECGEIIGCIGCSENKDYFHAHTLGMLMASAKAIEERFKLENAMQDIDLHSKLLGNILNSISDGLIYFSTDGTIREINNIAQEMLGRVDTSELSMLDVFNKDISKLMSAADSCIVDEEMNISAKRGVLRCFVTVTPVRSNQGELIGVVTILKKSSDIHSLANKVAGTQARYEFKDIIGSDPSFTRILDLARSAAKSPSNILLQGESGTGKELVAQAIHNGSDRRFGPFIAINCSAIPKELLESELFGYEEGTFTGALKGGKPGKFELAAGGTILLDEIGDMPLNMQAALLRALEDKRVTRLGSVRSIPLDIRIIASTNKNIQNMVQKGTFRDDLFYRLNVVNIVLPSLRERKTDIPLLIDYFIRKMNVKLNKNICGIQSDCLEVLVNYPWPGNTRELENVIEYCVNFCEDDEEIALHCLPEEMKYGHYGEDEQGPILFGHVTLEEAERMHIQTILRAMNGNKTQTSRVLGIDRGTLYNKIKKYDIGI